jgi:hypothetical protein
LNIADVMRSRNAAKRGFSGRREMRMNPRQDAKRFTFFQLFNGLFFKIVTVAGELYQNK